MEQIFDRIIKETEIENEKIKDFMVSELEPIGNEHGFWQVGNTIDEIIDEVEGKLKNENLLSDEESLKEIISYSDRDIRGEMLEILIEEILNIYDNNKYKVEINYFWEEIRVYND